MTDETYNGWTNRETWAVNLYIENEPVWTEMRDERMRELAKDFSLADIEDTARSLTELLLEEYAEQATGWQMYHLMNDIGSLYRVNWLELGQTWLEEVEL